MEAALQASLEAKKHSEGGGGNGAILNALPLPPDFTVTYGTFDQFNAQACLNAVFPLEAMANSLGATIKMGLMASMLEKFCSALNGEGVFGSDGMGAEGGYVGGGEGSVFTDVSAPEPVGTFGAADGDGKHVSAWKATSDSEAGYSPA